MFRPSLVSIVFTIAVTFCVIHRVEMSGLLPCVPCRSGSECEQQPPDYCAWGESRDACGRRVCSKGPGERCGGLLNAMGECGEGLMCRSGDGKCHGCSLITLDCYQ